MSFLKKYYKRIIKHDIINKFKFTNNKNLTKLKEITLNFGCEEITIQNFATTMLALEMITFKRSTITISKTPNLLLKIQKDHPAGCKVILRNKEIYVFLTRLYLEILPKSKNFTGFKPKALNSSFFFKIPSNSLTLKEFENHYPLFTNLPNLDVHTQTNSENRKKLLFIAKSFKLSIT